MRTANIDIRVLTSAVELKKVRDLEAQVWTGDDPIPVHQTATAAKHGGLILGAFDGKCLVGFQYSFAGFNGNKTYLCSHTLGIQQDYRSSGIGEKLKWRQREEALRMGYDLITWTYDPLETANGYLNIKKLGAICKNYLVDFYGEMTDALNEGLHSDRFMVEWWIKKEAVIQKLQQKSSNFHTGDVPAVIDLAYNENHFPIALSIDLTQTKAKGLAVPVPAHFQKLKEKAPAVAYDWRIKTRKVFTHYFQHGWQVDNFIKNDASHSFHQYVLTKQEG